MVNRVAGESRVVELAVVPNARHLGGLPAHDRPTQLQDVLRSGTLAGLTGEGAAALRSIGVRTVVDLRTEEERANAPEPDLARLGVRTVWAPLVERDPCPLGVNLGYGHAGFVWMYQNFLEHGRKAIVRLVELLGESDGGVLYHCSAGEDRTGLVTVVLLSLAGVSDEEIIADHGFSLSFETLVPRGHVGDAASQRMAAPLNGMRELLQIVRTRWGSAEGYLLDAGARQSAIKAFCARALTGSYLTPET